MRRKLVVTLTLGASLLCLLAVSVEAQRGRRTRTRTRGASAPAEQVAPQSAAIADALGELRWGMEPAALNTHFGTKIRERFRERLTKAPGAIEEDRIRLEMEGEIRRLRESYTRFEGTRSGWDLSFLRGEFTHGNRESMLVYRDENSQNFYFFIGGRLWKWFKAFDASVFQGQSFEQFAQAVQGRFGPAVERRGRLIENGPEQHWLEWQDASTRLRAIDQTRFYGFYCLVFEDKETLRRLPELRRNTINQDNQGHALVDSVMLPEGGAAPSSGDSPNADIVDRITGNVRRVQQAEPSQAQQPQQQPQRGRSGNQGQSQGQSRPQQLDLSDL
jgi:hypothetical protein